MFVMTEGSKDTSAFVFDLKRVPLAALSYSPACYVTLFIEKLRMQLAEPHIIRGANPRKDT